MGFRSQSLFLLFLHAADIVLANLVENLPPGFVRTGPATYIRNGPLPPGYIQAGPAFFQKPSEVGVLPRSMPTQLAIRPADLHHRKARQAPLTMKQATPNLKLVFDSVSAETRKALKDKCSALDHGNVPSASVVLKAISRGGGLKHLMPSRSDVFVHKGLNKPYCSALGGHCVSNFTLIKSVEEFTSKFSWKKCAIVGNSGSLLASR